MTAIMEYWPLIASMAAFIALVIVKVEQYRKMDQEAQDAAKADAEAALRRAITDWLLKAVTDAEADLGSGTGKLKLRAVYERACEVFGPSVAQVVTLEQLDELVQYPLEEMRRMLTSNAAVSNYVAPKSSVSAIGFEIPSDPEGDDE